MVTFFKNSLIMLNQLLISIDFLITYDLAPARTIGIEHLSVISNGIFSTKKKQAVVVFCSSYTDMFYAMENGPVRNPQQLRYSTYDFNDSYLGVTDRTGNRFKKPDNVIAKDLTDLIFKYSRNSHYNVIFKGIDGQDIILAENEGGEVISFIRIIKEILIYRDGRIIVEFINGITIEEDYENIRKDE